MYSSIIDIFKNPKFVMSEGTYPNTKQGSSTFKSTTLDNLLLVDKSNGLYVIFCSETRRFFVGNAWNLRARLENLRFNLKAGTYPNEDLKKMVDHVGGDLSKLSVVYFPNSDAEDVLGLQQILMNHFRESGSLINFNFKARVVGQSNSADASYCTYMFRNKKTRKFYVGTAKSPKGRKAFHLKQLKTGTHGNRKVQEEWNNYPNEEDWEWSFFLHSNKTAAYNHEQLILDEYFGKSELILNLASSSTDPINSVMTPEIEARRKANAAKALAAKFGFPVIVDGVEYPSIGVAADAIGVNQSTVSRWVKNPNNTRAVLANPELTVDRATRLDKGLRNHCALTLENNPAAKAIIVNGQHYPTVKAAMEATGINEKTLRRQAAGGLSSEVKWA